MAVKVPGYDYNNIPTIASLGIPTWMFEEPNVDVMGQAKEIEAAKQLQKKRDFEREMASLVLPEGVEGPELPYDEVVRRAGDFRLGQGEINDYLTLEGARQKSEALENKQYSNLISNADRIAKIAKVDPAAAKELAAAAGLPEMDFSQVGKQIKAFPKGAEVAEIYPDGRMNIIREGVEKAPKPKSDKITPKKLYSTYGPPRVVSTQSELADALNSGYEEMKNIPFNMQRKVIREGGEQPVKPQSKTNIDTSKLAGREPKQKNLTPPKGLSFDQFQKWKRENGM